MPAPSDDGSGDLPQFLRPEDIGSGKNAGRVGTTGTVAFLGEPARKLPGNNFGVQYAFAVKVKGVRFDWPIKVNTPNHRALHERFNGRTPKGIVTVEIKGYGENAKPYIAIT